MCLIFTKTVEPEDTLLVLAPIDTRDREDAVQKWQLTYINSTNAVNPPIAASVTFDSSVYRSDGTSSIIGAAGFTPFPHQMPPSRGFLIDSSKKGMFESSSHQPPPPIVLGAALKSALAPAPAPQVGVLMVVPIPNKHNMLERDFTLCAVDPADVSGIRASAAKGFQPFHKEQDWGQTTRGFGSFGAEGVSNHLTVQQIGNYDICVAPNLSDLETRARKCLYSLSCFALIC